MGVPVVAGDFGGPYYNPSTQAYAPFVMVGGSSRTFINGRSVLLLGQALTTGGPIVSATLVSVVTLVEGRPVLLGGALTNLATGWVLGVLQATGAAGTLID